MEVPRYYSDSFEIVGNVYGATLKFSRRAAVAGPAPPPPEVLVEVSQSWEHLKMMVFIVWRHIKAVEQKSGVSYPVPSKVLSDLGIAMEDWDAFWK